MLILGVLPMGRSCWALPDYYGNAATCIGFLRSLVEEDGCRVIGGLLCVSDGPGALFKAVCCEIAQSSRDRSARNREERRIFGTVCRTTEDASACLDHLGSYPGVLFIAANS
jgi:hypothetical protein